MNMINIFIFLIIFYLFKSNYKKYIKKNKFEVNGPFPLPIIGNLHQITNKPHIKCHELVKQYGDIFRVYLGDNKTIMVSDYKIIEELFIKNHNSFLERPITPSFSHCSDNQNGILLSNEKWLKNREMIQKAMKKGNVKNVYDLLNKQINDLIESVKPYSESGEPLNFQNGTVSKFCTCLENIFVLADVGHFGDYIGFLKPIYSLFLKLTDSNVPLARDYFYKKFYEHLKTIDNEKEENYDLLHTFIKEVGIKDKESVKSIVSNSLDLLVAGTDTAAKGIEWIILRIANNQDVQELIFKELKSIVNGCDRVEDRIYLSDRSSTPYLNATIKESMRITPITPYGIPRVVGKDLTIKGHFIPKGSHVVINYRALNHNESIYKNSNEFNPNRFLDNNIESFIPFSIGNRNCVGKQIANHELFLFVSNLILNYKITPITNKPIDTTENFGINIRPNSFKINVYKRI
ncbi:hypothetical protein ACTFIY_000658 [Dictyostelium cf. discoideum]